MMNKKVTALLLAAVMVMMSAATVYAAETTVAIDSVSIDVNFDDLFIGDDDSSIEVSVPDGEPYELDNYETINAPKAGWVAGDIPKIMVTLSAQSGCKFSAQSTRPSGIDVSGAAEAYYAERKNYPDYDILEVYIQLPEVNAYDETWSGEGPSGPGSGKSGGPTSGPAQGNTGGAWLRDAKGTWYCNADKTYTRSDWQKIDGKWYYFDSLGYLKTNKWINDNNKWYYVGPDGAMWTDRKTPDGYYVNALGVWEK